MSQSTGTAPVTLDFELDHQRNAKAIDGTFVVDAFVTLRWVATLSRAVRQKIETNSFDDGFTLRWSCGSKYP